MLKKIVTSVGTSTTMIQAPSINLVAAKTSVTTAVHADPKPLMAIFSSQPGS